LTVWPTLGVDQLENCLKNLKDQRQRAELQAATVVFPEN